MQQLPVSSETHYSAGPAEIFRLFRRHRHLLRQMIHRDIAQRYRGSALGILWSLINPLLMLSVYTFVFTIVFQARWTGTARANDVSATASTSEFALILFCGLLVHGFLAEILTRAPTLILHHVNFVKKVVFPLEILPLSILYSALFHTVMSLLVLLVAVFFLLGTPSVTILYVPLVMAPLILFATGMSWLLASLGVFFRDIAQLTGLIVTLLLFLSPVFYPADALPEPLRPYLSLNPLTIIIENMRTVILWGNSPDFTALLLHGILSLLICCLGFWWFQKTRRAFADIL